MNKYTVYFEIYGKKMKSTVFAEHELGAKQAVKNKISFHKVEKEKEDKDIFNDLFGGFSSNK